MFSSIALLDGHLHFYVINKKKTIIQYIYRVFLDVAIGIYWATFCRLGNFDWHL